MAPLTRKQSIIKATNMAKQEPEDELPQHTEPASVFSRLPAELQKTVVEYVRPSSCHSFTPSLTNIYLARPLVRLAKPLPGLKGASRFDASISLPRRYIESAPAGRKPFIDL
jgi:hypothetical protein